MGGWGWGWGVCGVMARGVSRRLILGRSACFMGILLSMRTRRLSCSETLSR